ncbi:MAG TPA: dihydroneopterin aldolase [Bacilli bacterium]
MKQNSDIIFLEGLEVECIIGIFDWEREQKQTVRIDLEMFTDIHPAAKSDRIEDALNYKTVAKAIIKMVEESQFYLLEKMAEEIANICLNRFQIAKIRLKVSKPGAIRGSKNVGILIERERQA